MSELKLPLTFFLVLGLCLKLARGQQPESDPDERNLIELMLSSPSRLSYATPNEAYGGAAVSRYHDLLIRSAQNPNVSPMGQQQQVRIRDKANAQQNQPRKMQSGTYVLLGDSRDNGTNHGLSGYPRPKVTDLRRLPNLNRRKTRPLRSHRMGIFNDDMSMILSLHLDLGKLCDNCGLNSYCYDVESSVGADAPHSPLVERTVQDNTDLERQRQRLIELQQSVQSYKRQLRQERLQQQEQYRLLEQELRQQQQQVQSDKLRLERQQLSQEQLAQHLQSQERRITEQQSQLGRRESEQQREQQQQRQVAQEQQQQLQRQLEQQRLQQRIRQLEQLVREQTDSLAGPRIVLQPGSDEATAKAFLAGASRFGLPSNQTLKLYENFLISYDISLKHPNWVLQHLTKGKMIAVVERGQYEFRPNETIHEFLRPTNQDYLGSGYQRGHMAPACNNSGHRTWMDQSFCLSNIGPQFPGLNEGPWRSLENYVDHLARRSRNMYVVSGAAYLPNDQGKQRIRKRQLISYRVFGKNKISVPTHYYKVWVREGSDGALSMEAFMLPNSRSVKPGALLGPFRVDIDRDLPSIEKSTGLVFFDKLDRRRVDKPQTFQQKYVDRSKSQKSEASSSNQPQARQ